MATVLPVYVKQTLNYQALLFISWFIPLPKKCENLGCHVTFIFAYKQSTHTHTHNHKRRHRKQVLKSDSGPSQCGDEGKKKVEKAQIAGKKKGGKRMSVCGNTSTNFSFLRAHLLLWKLWGRTRRPRHPVGGAWKRGRKDTPFCWEDRKRNLIRKSSKRANYPQFWKALTDRAANQQPTSDEELTRLRTKA